MFPTELVVIGVHSAKFPTEKLTANVQQAVMRHGIHHAVVNDPEHDVWRRYAVRAWPTVMLIDPAGKIVGQHAGEIDAAGIAPIIEATIADFDGRGLIDRTPVAGLRDAADDQPARQLNYPSKLIAAPGERLFVADTGHHRILEVQLSENGLSGAIVRSFGSGVAGLHDGPMATAQFHAPHGLAFVQNERGATLYVADTENHAIRAIDLVRETVRTLAGTGVKGSDQDTDNMAAIDIQLRSPWALALLGDVLFIAMAGSHQIWALVEEEMLYDFAGNGVEALVDGAHGQASFTQPSDLAIALDHLFVADAEASAIRAITLDGDPEVMTLIGHGLFEFGDVDGAGEEVRLQHPTGIAAAGQTIYIADSYNHKIKSLNPANGQVKTLVGSGKAGLADGAFAEAQLFEPEGLAVINGKLYIADTNNHVVRVADLKSQLVQTLALE